MGRLPLGRDRSAPSVSDGFPTETPPPDTRAVIVLGGGSDIGLAIAREFVVRGAEAVVLAGRNRDQMHRLALEAGIGVRVETVDFDARATDTHVMAIEEAFALAGDVQAVVVAFGVLGDTQSFEASPALAAGAVVTNFAGGVSASLAAARALGRQARPGSLVILSSLAMIRPRRSNYIYGATKAGLDFFARGLADSVRDRGVHVMVVRLGFVRTKMTEGIRRPFAGATTDEVARDIVDDLRHRRELSWAPHGVRQPTRVIAWALRIVPAPLARRI